MRKRFAVCLLSSALTACGRAPGTTAAAHNLVLVTIDTLRADHVGAYGYGRSQAAFVDAMDAIHGWNIGLGKGMEVSYNATDHFGLHKYSFFVVQNGDVTAISDWKALKKNIASVRPTTNKMAATNKVSAN